MRLSASLASPLVLLGTVALVLAGIALLPRREIRSPFIAIVRVLFPSWRFFDDIQHSPMLFARVALAGEPLGEWRPLLSASPRRWRNLAWNPEGNLLLAEYALLERLLADVADWDETRDPGPESLVSYELVLNLVREAVASDGVTAGGTRCQFKLVDAATPPGADASDLLISREHAA